MTTPQNVSSCRQPECEVRRGGRQKPYGPCAIAEQMDPFVSRSLTAPLSSEAFDELVTELNLLDRLLAIAVTSLPFQDAEESVSDVLWCLAKRITKVSESEPINDVAAFAATVLRRHISKVRSRNKQAQVHHAPAVVGILAEVAGSIADTASHEALCMQVLSEAPSRLQGRVRRAFELVVIEGRTWQDAATILDCCGGHVRRLVNKAKPVVTQLIREICP